MLEEVPVDRIKPDLHFLTEEGDPERCRIIVRHTVAMVRALGMRLIAEGVENVSQAQFLHSIGCSEMQGFHFYKPMSVEEFERLADSAAPALTLSPLQIYKVRSVTTLSSTKVRSS